MSKAPDPTKWTLRFKLHRTTVLVFVNPTQSFGSIKSDLLDAIKATGINNINGTPLPSNPDEIVFGVPVDRHNLSRGWMGVEIPELDNMEESRGKGVKKGSILNASPAGAGLRDGQMMAFKFRKEGEQAEDEIVDDEWDVVIPFYEEDAE